MTTKSVLMRPGARAPTCLSFATLLGGTALEQNELQISLFLASSLKPDKKPGVRVEAVMEPVKNFAIRPAKKSLTV